MPLTRSGVLFASIAMNSARRHLVLARLLGEDARAAAPGQHHHHQRGADGERHPAALDDLEQVGQQEDEVDRRGRARSRAPPSPADQCQHFHSTRKAIAVVITIVPVTAMP